MHSQKESSLLEASQLLTDRAAQSLTLQISSFAYYQGTSRLQSFSTVRTLINIVSYSSFTSVFFFFFHLIFTTNVSQGK